LMTEGVTRKRSAGDRKGLNQISRALAKFREFDDPYGTGLALNALGEDARLAGAHGDAQVFFAEALDAMRRTGNRYWTSLLLENLAYVQLQLKNWQAAALLLEEALQLAKDYDNSLNLALYVAAMGHVALIRGRPEEGARLFGATDSFLRSLGVDFEPADRLAFEQNL